MNEIMPIILTIIIFIGAIILGYVILSNNLKSYKIKIDEAQLVVDELLKTKLDLLNSTKEIITKEIEVDSKFFTNLKNIEYESLSMFNLDRKLIESYELIQQIKDDYSEIDELDSFKDIIGEVQTVDEKLEATKAFYNKYTKKLNNLTKKFPTNLLAKILKIENKSYFKID